MKEAIISLYEICEIPARKDKRIRIISGSSFVQNVLKDRAENIYLCRTVPCPIEEWKELLSTYDRIYFSATLTTDLCVISPLIDKRWVIGGPLTQCDYVDLIKASFPDTVIWSGTFEDYLGIPLSSTYTEHWHDWVEKRDPSDIVNVMSYSMIGKGCYWGKCIFCSAPKYNVIYQRNTEKIISSLMGYKNYSSSVHVGVDSVKPSQLEILLEYRKPLLDKNIDLVMYIRGDYIIESFFKSCKETDFSGFHFIIGLESFSQGIVDSLNKGIKVSTTLNIVKHITERNGNVILTIMNHYPNYTLDKVKDSLKNIQWLKDNIKNKKKIYLVNPGRIEWPTENEAKLFGEYENYGSIDFHNTNKKNICFSGQQYTSVNMEANHNYPTSFKEFIVSKIPFGSDDWESNKIVCQEVIDSGFYIHGKPFESLRKEE